MIDIKNVNWNKDLYNLNLTEEVNKDKDTVLHYVLKNNKQENINLNKEQFDYLIKNSNLKQLNKYGSNPLMLALDYNKRENLFLQKEQFDYLFKNSDLKNVNNYGETALIILAKKNEKENLNFDKEQFDDLIKNSDLKVTTSKGYNAFMLLLMNNKEQNIKLNEEKINYLIENSNLNQKNELNQDILMLLIDNYKKENLNLTEEQLEKIIKQSDLKNVDVHNRNVLRYLLNYNEVFNLLNDNVVNYVLNESDVSLITLFQNNKKGNNVIMTILNQYSKYKNVIKESHIKLLLEKNDLNYIGNNDFTTLSFYMCAVDNGNDLNYNENIFNYLLKNSNVDKQKAFIQYLDYCKKVDRLINKNILLKMLPLINIISRISEITYLLKENTEEESDKIIKIMYKAVTKGYLISNIALKKENKLFLKQAFKSSNDKVAVTNSLIEYLIENNDILNEVFPLIINKTELINQIKNSKKDNLLELEEIEKYLNEKSFLTRFKNLFNLNKKKTHIEDKKIYKLIENKIELIKEKKIDIEMNRINDIDIIIKDLKNKGDIKINTELDTFYISLFNNLLDNILMVGNNKNGEKYIELYEKSLEELKNQLIELEKDNDKTLINIKEINKQLTMKRR